MVSRSIPGVCYGLLTQTADGTPDLSTDAGSNLDADMESEVAICGREGLDDYGEEGAKGQVKTEKLDWTTVGDGEKEVIVLD